MDGLIKKKGLNLKWRIIEFIPIIIVGYFIYGAFYPSEGFYREDFKEVTGIELPKNSKFEYKTAGYPDTHGDYSSVSIIEIGTKFYIKLQSDLTKNGLTESEKTIGCVEMDNAKGKMNELKIEREFSKEDDDIFFMELFYQIKKRF